MPESKFQKDLCKFLRKRNALVFNFIGNMYQSGIPDLYVCHRYWSGWLELKFDKGDKRKKQEYNIRELRRRGQQAFFFRQVGPDFILSNEDDTWSIAFTSILDWWEYITDHESTL